jgi:hypothetical protein
MGVLDFAHAYGGHTEAEEAGVVRTQLAGTQCEVEHIRLHQVAQLWVRDAGWLASDAKDGLDTRVEKALAQDALSHHAGRYEKYDFH